MEMCIKIKWPGQKKGRFFKDLDTALRHVKSQQVLNDRKHFSFSINGEFGGHDQTSNDLRNACERKEIHDLKDRQDVIHNDLKRAARVARSMGLHVKASKDKHGRISSYYVSKTFGSKQFRISDHDIPLTEKRNLQKEFFDGGAHVYASAKPNRRNLWWKRAFLLLLNDRDVPGFKRERFISVKK